MVSSTRSEIVGYEADFNEREGPVSPSIVAKVNDVVRVLNLTGTTEGLFMGVLWPTREDWHWFAFHPLAGFEFKEIEPGVYEHWVHRKPQWDLFQGVFYTFPNQQSVNLKDLYKRHPTKPYLYAYTGRSDDAVVLSNGYKVAPLEAEALITTHPAVEGCLVIGQAKPQAGLLIELKDPSARSTKLFDSIWEKVERANASGFQKIRFQRDYVAFAEPDKPFIRTDKSTIKRRATLELYKDFVDHFYSTREAGPADEAYDEYKIDTSTEETILQSVQKIMASVIPEFETADADEDVFEMGLDSLLVYQAIRIIRGCTGLQEQIAPRHLYAHPTLAKFSAHLGSLLQRQAKPKTNGVAHENSNGVKPNANGIAHEDTNGHTNGVKPKANGLANEQPNGVKPKTNGLAHEYTNGEAIRVETQDAQKVIEKHVNGPVSSEHDELDAAIYEHKRRTGFKMNPFDAVNPNHYMGFTLFFALPPNANFKKAFEGLQSGLCRAFEVMPELDGKMVHASEHEFGYKKGEYAIVIPPTSMATRSNPRQLVYKEMTKALPSYSKMRESNFSPSLYEDKVVLDCYPFPSMPADVMVAHANFVEGGCILAANFIHTAFDGMGGTIALRVWAECCRFMQGDKTATCDWYDPQSFNHNLPEILYQQEGHSKPVDEVDNTVWDFLPFFPPDYNPEEREIRNKASLWDASISGTSPENLRPVYRRQPQWPATPSDRSLSSTFFLLSRENLQKLKADVNSHPTVKGQATSISDIVQAFLWQTAIRARYLVAKEHRGQTFRPDEMSILEIPIDGRLYFSGRLPSTYTGSMLIMSRTMMPVEELCSPNTSLAKVAHLIRKTIAKVDTALVHDAYTLLRSMTDYTKPATANMGLEHMNEMISNMILWQQEENSSSFGEGLFSGGKPKATYPQIERGHRRFRFSLVHPMRADGGVELELGTLPEELKMLQQDEHFSKYARLLDVRRGTGW